MATVIAQKLPNGATKRNEETLPWEERSRENKWCQFDDLWKPKFKHLWCCHVTLASYMTWLEQTLSAFCVCVIAIVWILSRVYEWHDQYWYFCFCGTICDICSVKVYKIFYMFSVVCMENKDKSWQSYPKKKKKKRWHLILKPSWSETRPEGKKLMSWHWQIFSKSKRKQCWECDFCSV